MISFEVELIDVGRNKYNGKFIIKVSKAVKDIENYTALRIYKELKNHLMSSCIMFDVKINSKKPSPIFAGIRTVGFMKVRELKNGQNRK